MSDFLYYAMNFFPYVVALVQCIMYIFIIIFLAKATGPIVNALKTYIASSKRDDACGCSALPVTEAAAPTEEEAADGEKSAE
ncbi:hypothetical protein [Hydrogenoanaerobacterium sp.]|uniref:hypothetical protein n=1 Tax=Hydrogenoanaerobacterium sp. TaxID=2953763 RepID=UPI0028A1EA82|nr:hypothetical protein [Hydrogenoanaerobacterium sp.]